MVRKSKTVLLCPSEEKTGFFCEGSIMHPIAQEGFNQNVDAYDRARPEYPSAAMEDLCKELAIEGKVLVSKRERERERVRETCFMPRRNLRSALESSQR